MVKLIRLTLKSDPNTILPIDARLGDVFEVIGYDHDMLMVDKLNNRIHRISVYHILTNDGEAMAPCELFEAYLDAN